METNQTMIKIYRTTHRSIKMAAASQGLSMQDFIEQLMTNWELKKLIEEDCDND